MVLTNTYTKRRGSGFSLIEYLVTLTISVLLISLGAAASENFLRSVAFLSNAVDIDAKNRIAIDRMSREIRGCDAIEEAWSNGLVLRFATNLVTFQQIPATRELVRVDNTSTQVFLKGCDSVRFGLFRRNSHLLTEKYGEFPAGSITNAKIVQINWVCSRRLLGFKANTGRMESARVVIRNQQ